MQPQIEIHHVLRTNAVTFILLRAILSVMKDNDSPEFNNIILTIMLFLLKDREREREREQLRPD